MHACMHVCMHACMYICLFSLSLSHFAMPHQQWKLTRPDVIISVTGGATDFDLKMDLESIFKPMM